MTRLTSTLVIIIPLLAAACVNAITCGSATCSDTQECCNDFRNGFVCYDKTTYSCPATTTSTGAAGNLLCPANKVACGEACYSESEYSCCNRQLAPKGTCASPTNSPTSAPTSSPTTPVTSAPVVLNCPGANNFGGVNCSDASLCCGYGTITPSCLPADGSKKCCVHYKASTQCNPDETCGGSGGPGASSYASCGNPGTTFCDKGTGQGTFCTAELPTCCGYYSGFGFCCAAGCACNNSYYTCSCPSTSTSAPSTVAPTTVAPTTRVTSAPVTSAPVVNNCPGANNFGGVNCSDASLCCGYGTITPSCLPADGSKKCCTHYKASTQCNLDETCGGSGGPGASSYASCGKPGTTFCDKGTGQGAFCTADAPTCCGYTSGFGFCCAAGCACNNSYYTCSCPSTATTAPSTAAPVTSAPTTYAIPTTVRPTCASGQSLCGDTCFDVSKEFCCGNRVVCGSGQSCNIGQAYSTCCNRTLSYCGKPEFGVKCYDPSTQVCCGAEVYMPTVCGTDETCRLFPSAGCDKKSS